MRNIFLEFFSDFLEVAMTLMSLCYWYRTFPREWLHYQNFDFLMLGKGNGKTPWITPRKYLKLCWTVFQHLVELSVPYTLRYAISKNDYVYFFNCFIPVAIVTVYDASPGTTFLFVKTVCFSGWLLTTTWGRWDRITDWFLQKYVSSGRVENSVSVADSSVQ